jgi:hypothetical protein
MTVPFVAPAPGELPDKVPLTPFPGGDIVSERREPPRPLYRQPLPAEPYPVDKMGPLAEATKAIIEVTQAPAGICANAVLAVTALATQALADVCLPGTSRPHPISLYLLSIAESGERKTSADREATQGVRNREQELREIAVDQERRYRNEADAYDAARKAAVKKGKGDTELIRAALDSLGGPPAKPPLPILIVTEPTVEGLVKLLADSISPSACSPRREAPSSAATP